MIFTPSHTTVLSYGFKVLYFLSVQFDLLEQLGYEGYSVLVNTSELQSHVLATSKGKAFHKMRQQLGKPLENPFIGYVFSEDSGKSAYNHR